MGALTDPQNKIIYQMHQYLDSDGSGTSVACVSSTIGQGRIQAATQWLKSNGKLGIIGEFASSANSQCETAVHGMLSYMDSKLRRLAWRFVVSCWAMVGRLYLQH